jgi:4,5-DOPA dioxygenase extradiol
MFDKLNTGPRSPRMPLLFIGHGSPMNAIATNAYTKTLSSLATKIPRPKAIVVISAHWMTEGTWLTEMPQPKTIHDFYGFPQALFDVQYPAPGAPALAKEIRAAIEVPSIHPETEAWGLDHGTWSVLRHMYPNADVPVLQLSLYMGQPAEYHIQLGQELAKLRDKGVLILGSGNIVHNLRRIRWEPDAKAFDWAEEFDGWVKQKLLDRDFSAVMKEYHLSAAGRLSVPTLDHYLPLHYVLGAADSSDELKFEYEEMQNGSISMRSWSLTAKS